MRWSGSRSAPLYRRAVELEGLTADMRARQNTRGQEHVTSPLLFLEFISLTLSLAMTQHQLSNVPAVRHLVAHDRAVVRRLCLCRHKDVARGNPAHGAQEFPYDDHQEPPIHGCRPLLRW